MLKKYLNKILSLTKIKNSIIPLIADDEALKILNFNNKDNLTVEKVIERAKKYIENNNPYQGGSFYIQNKIYYSKLKLLPICKNYHDYILKMEKSKNNKEINKNKNNKIENELKKINQTLNKNI